MKRDYAQKMNVHPTSWYNAQLLALLSARRVANVDLAVEWRGTRNEPAPSPRANGHAKALVATLALCVGLVGCTPNGCTPAPVTPTGGTVRSNYVHPITNDLAYEVTNSFTVGGGVPADMRVEMIFAPTTLNIANGTSLIIGRIGTNEIKPGMLLRVKPDRSLEILPDSGDVLEVRRGDTTIEVGAYDEGAPASGAQHAVVFEAVEGRMNNLIVTNTEPLGETILVTNGFVAYQRSLEEGESITVPSLIDKLEPFNVLDTLTVQSVPQPKMVQFSVDRVDGTNFVILEQESIGGAAITWPVTEPLWEAQRRTNRAIIGIFVTLGFILISLGCHIYSHRSR